MNGLLVPRTDDNRVIVGQLLTFDANAGRWLLNGKPPPADLRLLVVGTTAVAQHWQDGKVISSVWDGDLAEVCEEGNEAIPREEWEDSPDGKKKAPWSVSSVVYLVDMSTAKKLTVAAATVGQRIAVEILSDQIATMCKLRGVDVIPEIILGVDSFPTRFGTRKPRPDYCVVAWRDISGKAAPQLTLSKVEKPTSGELFDDQIPFE
jgi:hypothetical protein